MLKRVSGRKLSRTTNERKSLFRGLENDFILNGVLKTTEAKAKAVRSDIEKAVTYAKNKGDQATYHLQKKFTGEVIEQLMKIAPIFKDRAGGYTRIVKLGSRVKDNAQMVIMEWVDEKIKDEIIKTKDEIKNKNKREKTKSQDLNVKQLKSGEDKSVKKSKIKKSKTEVEK
jgi:large subunit ribosomal protein L17